MRCRCASRTATCSFNGGPRPDCPCFSWVDTCVGRVSQGQSSDQRTAAGGEPHGKETLRRGLQALGVGVGAAGRQVGRPGGGRNWASTSRASKKARLMRGAGLRCRAEPAAGAARTHAARRRVGGWTSPMRTRPKAASTWSGCSAAAAAAATAKKTPPWRAFGAASSGSGWTRVGSPPGRGPSRDFRVAGSLLRPGAVPQRHGLSVSCGLRTQPQPTHDTCRSPDVHPTRARASARQP
jgi:hypothetical protein